MPFFTFWDQESLKPTTANVIVPLVGTIERTCDQDGEVVERLGLQGTVIRLTPAGGS